MILSKFKPNIIKTTPTYLAINGKRNELIETVSQELREFLEQYKGKHINGDEILDFYKKIFDVPPNLKIINNKPVNFEAGFRTNNKSNSNEYSDFEILILSKSPLDKIKNLLKIKSTKKTFYVNKRFVENLIHEQVHFLQHYTKPTNAMFNKNIDKLCSNPKDIIKSLDIIDNSLKSLIGYEYVYEPHFIFNKKLFKKKINKLFKKEKEENPLLYAEHLKKLIRDAENEIQAYNIGDLESQKFRYSFVKNNGKINKIFKSFNNFNLNINFYFKNKIAVMKEEFFKTIAKEREIIQKNNKK